MNSYVIIVVRIKRNWIIANFPNTFKTISVIQLNLIIGLSFVIPVMKKSFRIWTLIGINCYKIICFCNIILLPAINVLKIYILLNFLNKFIPKSEVFLIISFELYIFEFKENLFILFKI